MSAQDSTASFIENDERKRVIGGAIHELPIRIRETFVLHFYEELSHQEIAQKQEISYPNVCKRISQARAILREELRGYFMGEENVLIKSVVTPALTEWATEDLSSQNVEEVETLEDVEKVDTPVDEQGTSSVVVPIAATVVGEEAIEIVRFQPSSELGAIATTSHDTLSMRKTAASWVQAPGSKWLLASIFPGVQWEEETQKWGDFWMPISHLMPTGHQVRHQSEKWKRKIGSPPGSGFPFHQSLIKSLSQLNMRGNVPVSLTLSKEADFPNNVKRGPTLYSIGIGLV